MDDSWQPTKLELEAALGAAHERQLELEWRVQQAESRAKRVRLTCLGHRDLAISLSKMACNNGL